MPPANPALPEVRITPRTAPSAKAASISAARSASEPSVITFIDRPGTSQVIVVTPSPSVCAVKSLIFHPSGPDRAARPKAFHRGR